MTLLMTPHPYTGTREDRVHSLAVGFCVRKCHRDAKTAPVAHLAWIATNSTVLNELYNKVALQEGIMPSKQLEDNFDLLPDGVIVCDREGKILRANAVALKLFEVASEDLCRGVDYQQFLIKALMDDARIQSNTLELHPARWDLNALLREAVATQHLSARSCWRACLQSVWCPSWLMQSGSPR
jgi:PAS domain-containing protein